MELSVNSLEDTFALQNGVRIPCVGFGTWQSADGEECEQAVLAAIGCGYRHIDTAAAYGNEESVGRAIRKSGVARDRLFVTTKLWNGDHGYEAAKAAIDKSLSALQSDYIDLYLIHWPNPKKFRERWQEANAESWRAMEEALRAGKIRALGLSNFHEHHIAALMETAEIPPQVNQIKLCPGIVQPKVAEASLARNMLLEAYSPMGTGAIFSNAEMQEIAAAHGRTVAQVCVRWSLQMGFLPLPKSVTPQRIRENAQVFDFSLGEDECARIASLQDTGIRPERNPDETDF